jgi:hypothetical protein
LECCNPNKLPPGWTAAQKIGGRQRQSGVRAAVVLAETQGVRGVGLLRGDHPAGQPLRLQVVGASVRDRAHGAVFSHDRTPHLVIEREVNCAVGSDEGGLEGPMARQVLAVRLRRPGLDGAERQGAREDDGGHGGRVEVKVHQFMLPVGMLIVCPKLIGNETFWLQHISVLFSISFAGQLQFYTEELQLHYIYIRRQTSL